MTFIKKYIGNLYLSTRVYLGICSCIVLFVIAFFVPVLLIIPKAAWYLLLVLIAIDYLFLFILSPTPLARRITAERFSNGDQNKVTLQVTNSMRFDVRIDIIDELPAQFQQRDWIMRHPFKAGQ